MANINEILARAAALRDETALNSISPERAGGIMYDTLLALNELWLQQGAALVISKIYASVSAMEADTAPVSDLTGKPLRPGQIVVIASSDSDSGSVYRYNGTETPSWSLVGSIGNLEPVDSLDSDSTILPLAAHQGKVLDGKISQLGQKLESLTTEVEAEMLSFSNSVNGYINGTGDIVESGNFKTYYFPCTTGQNFHLSFDIFDSSVARAFGVYSTDDPAQLGPATLVELGPIGQGDSQYDIEVTSVAAKLLCVTTRGYNTYGAKLFAFEDDVNNFDRVRKDVENFSGARRIPDSTNPLLLGTFATKAEARQVTYPMRRVGLSIVYKLTSGKTISERFIGINQNQWTMSIYWEPDGMQHIFKPGFRPNAAVEKYIVGVECTDNTKPLYMNMAVTSTPVDGGVSLSAYIRLYRDENGTKTTIGTILGLVLDSYSSQNSVRLEFLRLNSAYPKTWIILNVKDMYDDAITTFSITGTDKEIEYVFVKDLSNSFMINEGNHFPFENVSGALSAVRDAYVTNYFKAILDIEVYGANETEGFVYQIALLSKERTANNWGNGVWLRKLSATDYSVVEDAIFKSPSAIPSIKSELDKIAGTSPAWMTLDAFGKTFRILVNGTYLESDYSGQWNATNLLGANYYISPMCYRPLLSASWDNGFKTLREAVEARKTGMFSIGQNSVVGFKQINYNVDDLREMEENYKSLAPNPVFPKVRKASLIRLYDDDSNMLYVMSASSRRIYYSICPTDSKHIRYPSQDIYVAPYFYFASKENPTDLTKVILPSVLPGASDNSIGRKKYVFEMSNGDVLLEVENGTRYSANVRTQNIYKITGLFNLPVVDGVITVPVENITLTLPFNNGSTRLSAFEQACEAQPGEIYLAPYGAGITAVIYHSVDYGDTWEVIFCGIVDNQTLNIPPKAESQGTATAYGEWPTAQSIISSTPLDWSGTGNGNIHIHGIVYDPWMNRLWVCTGDGSGYPDGVTGIWWTDDNGRSWHRISTRNQSVLGDATTQFMFPIPMEHNVLFATDGAGDGLYRWSRTTKDEEIVIEPAHYFFNEKTSLVVEAGRWSRCRGFVLCSFAPDNLEQGDWMNRGGILATPNGYDFAKIYEDEFTEIGEITPDMTEEEKLAIYAHAYETAEIGWCCDIVDCGSFLVLRADKGGIIRLDLEDWK